MRLQDTDMTFNEESPSNGKESIDKNSKPSSQLTLNDSQLFGRRSNSGSLDSGSSQEEQIGMADADLGAKPVAHSPESKPLTTAIESTHLAQENSTSLQPS